MSWDWSYAFEILPDLMEGMWITVLVTSACAAIALGGGLLLAVFGTIGGTIGRLVTRGLVELFRGVPILVLLYFGFYALPQIGVILPAFLVGVAGYFLPRGFGGPPVPTLLSSLRGRETL